MDAINSTFYGLSIALAPSNLGYTFIGVLLGTLVGVLPGLGAAATIALLMPISFGMDHVPAIMMMCGIFYGSQYGGSTTSILINTPGEASSLMTAIDGYQMAKHGRAGAALAVAAIGSFIASTLGIVALTLLAHPLSSLALRFGPVEYFALMVFALTIVTALSGSSPAKAAISTILGLMLATVGIDTQSGMPRFDFGLPALMNGVPFAVVVVGMFALGEVFSTLEHLRNDSTQRMIPIRDKLYLTREDWCRSIWPILRGTLIGFYVGVLPGAGATVATFFSYAAEKRISEHPEQFGKGAIEGVAGPELANNAAMIGDVVPLLTMGIPSSGTTAVLLGVFVMFGIIPGPLLFEDKPEVVWGLIASMYVGNVMLLILNLPLVGVFVRLLHTPLGILFPLIIAIAAVAIYGVDGDAHQLFILLFFGILGYTFRRCNIPAAPLILGLVLGDLLEQSFRQSMALSGGDLRVFLQSGISKSLLLLAVVSMLPPALLPRLKRRRVTDATA